VSSLYEWAGGGAASERLINAFCDRVEGDDLLSGLFPGGVSEEHRVHVIAWWTEVFGGPARYTEDLGGYERMLGKHRGLAITPEQRFRFRQLPARRAGRRARAAIAARRTSSRYAPGSDAYAAAAARSCSTTTCVIGMSSSSRKRCTMSVSSQFDMPAG
jgi:hypothetical protein